LSPFAARRREHSVSIITASVRFNSAHTTQDIQLTENFYNYKVTTIMQEKQSVSFMAIDIWKDILHFLKCVCVSKANKTLPPDRTKSKLMI